MKRYVDVDLADSLLLDGWGIDEIPTADVEPVVNAHWEYHESVCTDEGIKGCFECSACKAAIYEEVFDLMYECGQTKRCGACGARMGEKEKEK